MSRVTQYPTNKVSAKASLLLTVFLMTGCASYQKDHFTVGSTATDYRTKHPIVVSQDETREDLIVTSGMKGMSTRHYNQVHAFLRHFRTSGARTVRVILPAGSHNESAARNVGRDVIALMKDERIAANQISVSRYHAVDHGDAATIRISYTSTVANVTSKCGEWREDMIHNPENVNYGNFGCATQNNLAEMIANPQDLIGPRGQSEIDAERRGTVIENWRTNGTPALPSLL